MSKPFTPEEWVRAAREGDEAAWNCLYHRYHPELYAGALGLCGNASAAKDVVQDSFVTAYLKLSQLKDPASFGGWLKKILIHRCYRMSHQRVHQELHPELPDGDPYLQYVLEKKLDEGVRSGRLLTTIASLPETLCSAILLRYFTDHQSYRQIADILSIPIGTVRSRLNEARAKLAAQWLRPPAVGIQAFRESEEWNQFYKDSFTVIHAQDVYKNRFIGHLEKDVQIIAGSQPARGSFIFEKMIMSDRQAGSWLSPTAVTSCGNISIIEGKAL